MPIKIMEKRESGRIQGLSKCLKYRTPIISGTGKANMNFKFCRHINQSINRNRSPLEIS